MNTKDENRDGLLINHGISAQTVRLIDQNGEMIGVVSKSQAIQMAGEVGLDLVEISPNAEPPVCKILDYGKHKYESQKKKAEARKKQKIVEIKEIKMRPVIDSNDYQVKIRNMLRFLEDGNKVKVTMRFRGREVTHQELGMDVLKRVQDDLAASCKVEVSPRFEGRQIILLLGPK